MFFWPTRFFFTDIVLIMFKSHIGHTNQTQVNSGALTSAQTTVSPGTPLHVSASSHNPQGQFYSTNNQAVVNDRSNNDAISQQLGAYL